MSGKVEYCGNNSYTLLTLTCDTCHKYFNGRKPYNEHLQSTNHKKKLKEKTLLNVASQENFNSQITTLHSDEVFRNEDLNVKKKIIDDFQYGKLHECEKSSTLSFTGWKPIENSALPPVLCPKSAKECKQFYIECAVCQLYFTSEKSAAMHFSSDEHKSKDAHHREIEELYNSIKNVDIQEIVENLLYETPSLGTENNVKTNISPVLNCKPRTFQADELKLPLSSGRTKDKKLAPYPNVLKLPLSDGRTKEKLYPHADELKLPLSDGRTKEKKFYHGCEVCGISSFSSVISSLNHLTTAEHCRRAAMQVEAKRLNSKISSELPLVSSSIDFTQKAKESNYENITSIPPHVISSNSDFYRTCQQEQRNSDNISLNPIGYERKQKHKQYQQSVNAIGEPVFLPDSYNFDYDGKASSNTAQYFSEVKLNPLVQEYKSPINSDLPLVTQTVSQKYVSKPFPRLAATFPQNDTNFQQNNLSSIKIIGLDQDVLF